MIQKVKYISSVIAIIELSILFHIPVFYIEITLTDLLDVSITYEPSIVSFLQVLQDYDLLNTDLTLSFLLFLAGSIILCYSVYNYYSLYISTIFKASGISWLYIRKDQHEELHLITVEPTFSFYVLIFTTVIPIVLVILTVIYKNNTIRS